MNNLDEIGKKVESVESRIKEENTLATNVINKFITLIFGLIIFIFINNALWIIGTFWYNSLPQEETEIIQDADTMGDNSPINQDIGE